MKKDDMKAALQQMTVTTDNTEKGGCSCEHCKCDCDECRG